MEIFRSSLCIWAAVQTFLEGLAREQKQVSLSTRAFPDGDLVQSNHFWSRKPVCLLQANHTALPTADVL